jgi:HEAT repeat protein
MTKLFPILVALAAAHLQAGPATTSETPATRAWAILEQGVTNKSAAKRATAIHALRLLPDETRARSMAQNALADSNPNVRAAAPRALGLMRDASSVLRLKAALEDKEPAVVLAAAHSLLQLGQPQEAYEVDYEVLTGERKAAQGFVASQLDELKDSKAVAMMGVETGVGFAPFGSPAYEVFKRVRKDRDSPVMVAATKELAGDPDPKIDAALRRGSSDKKWPVRAAAVYAIAKRGNPALLDSIIPRLEDKNDIVRYDASAAVLWLSGRKTPESTR